MTRIDLHAHSTASDGTLTPAALVRAAADAGLDVIALTDHDTTGGWAEAVAALPAGLTLVRGAELSCRWNGVRPGIALHLLAYLFDPEEPVLVAELAQVREGRRDRARRMVDLIRADGIELDWDGVLADAAGGTIGRPHLARALVRLGLVGSVSEAFGPRWLGERYRLPKPDLDVFRAVSLVRAAGGVPVLAHPQASARGRIVPESLIAELAGAGLFGLEAEHEDHTPAQRARVRELADELGLVATGSSDFHGGNKTVLLGANLTDPEAYQKIVTAAWGRPAIIG
ncbi:PHP domain-containing protein [Rugosimonospora acidiphila]|uniref:PHP domain-containing protein n=1 Tax=Rugosimonospora acidiphila TaxID=556531 RepID=A0ABP9SAX3_9ACTN